MKYKILMPLLLFKLFIFYLNKYFSFALNLLKFTVDKFFLDTDKSSQCRQNLMPH